MRPASPNAHGAAVVVEGNARVNAIVGAALPAHARRRGVVVLVHGRGPGEPWSPATTTLRGVVAACVDNGIAARWDPLGRTPTSLGPLAELVAPSADRRTIVVRLADAVCELPRAWVGRHVLVVSPMVMPERAATDASTGPHAATLGALATAAHARGGDHVAVGAAVLAEIFAGFTWVLDATTALVRGPRGRTSAVACNRVVVHGATGCTSARVAEQAVALDRWIGDACRGEPDGLAVAGALAGEPWPMGTRESIGVDGPRWVERARGRGREARRE